MGLLGRSARPQRTMGAPGDDGVIDLTDDTSDVALVVAISRGDHGALEVVYRRHGPAVYGMALRVLRDADRAGDVVQDVMCGLWDRPERFDPDRGALRPYLLRVAHGRAVDIVRAEVRRANREAGQAPTDELEDTDLEREVIALLRAESVREAITRLSPAEREAIDLAYFGGHTYRDVAVILGIPEGTVKSRIRLALAKLAAHLDEHRGDAHRGQSRGNDDLPEGGVR
jgi:RNA polymerase sigma-70 factor, ECF subfamily